MAQEQHVLNTGDSLAKPEHHDQINDPQGFPVGAISPVSSVLAHWPEAKPEHKSEEISEQDYNDAKESAFLAIVEYFARTTADQPLHKNLISKLAIIQGYEAEKSKVGNEPMSTGGMIPVLKGPSGTIDDDVIPVTNAKTTDPFVQPADSKIPASGSDAVSEKLKALGDENQQNSEPPVISEPLAK